MPSPKTLTEHISDLTSASCALQTMVELAEKDGRYGEAFLLECIMGVVVAGSEALDEIEFKESMKHKAPVLELISKCAGTPDCILK